MTRFSLILALTLLISSCTFYTLNPRGKTNIGGLYTVRSEIAWNKATIGKTEIWTIDGPSLQELRFVNGLSDGDKLFENPAKENSPEYKSEMSFLEIKEFIETSAATSGIVEITSRNFRPYKFGSLDGFRAELSYTHEDGLLREGLAAGTKKDGKLYLIFYSGTRLHYFQTHLDEVEYILRSIKIL